MGLRSKLYSCAVDQGWIEPSQVYQTAIPGSSYQQQIEYMEPQDELWPVWTLDSQSHPEGQSSISTISRYFSPSARPLIHIAALNPGVQMGAR